MIEPERMMRSVSGGFLLVLTAMLAMSLWGTPIREAWYEVETAMDEINRLIDRARR